MKTAEEWLREHRPHGYVEGSIWWNDTVNDLKNREEQIKLDAYKAGMTEAAEIVKHWHTNRYSEKPVAFPFQSSMQAILTARDNKTSL